MYAAQDLPFPPCVALRLIGVLDADFVAAFSQTERELRRSERGIVLVDVRDLTVQGNRDLAALVDVVRTARAEGRDIRLDLRRDTRSGAWRHAAKQYLSGVPPVDAELRSSVRRTIILAHSRTKKRSTFGQ